MASRRVGAKRASDGKSAKWSQRPRRPFQLSEGHHTGTAK